MTHQHVLMNQNAESCFKRVGSGVVVDWHHISQQINQSIWSRFSNAGSRLKQLSGEVEEAKTHSGFTAT